MAPERTLLRNAICKQPTCSLDRCESVHILPSTSKDFLGFGRLAPMPRRREMFRWPTLLLVSSAAIHIIYCNKNHSIICMSSVTRGKPPDQQIWLGYPQYWVFDQISVIDFDRREINGLSGSSFLTKYSELPPYISWSNEQLSARGLSVSRIL